MFMISEQFKKHVIIAYYQEQLNKNNESDNFNQPYSYIGAKNYMLFRYNKNREYRTTLFYNNRNNEFYENLFYCYYNTEIMVIFIDRFKSSSYHYSYYENLEIYFKNLKESKYYSDFMNNFDYSYDMEDIYD